MIMLYVLLDILLLYYCSIICIVSIWLSCEALILIFYNELISRQVPVAAMWFFQWYVKNSFQPHIHRECSQRLLSVFLGDNSMEKAREEQTGTIPQDSTGLWAQPTHSPPLHCWMNWKCCAWILQCTASRCRNYRLTFLKFVITGIHAWKSLDQAFFKNSKS